MMSSYLKLIFDFSRQKSTLFFSHFWQENLISKSYQNYILVFFPSIGNAMLSFCDVTQAFSREKNSISKILNFYGKSHCFTFATFNPSNFTKISIISKIFNFYVNVILWIRLNVQFWKMRFVLYSNELFLHDEVFCKKA